MTGTGETRSSSHLDDATRAELRAMLLEARTAQEQAAEEHARTASELRGQEDVDSLLERELAEAAVQRAQEAIADIDAALARLDDGTYGVCESCGEPIARERLEIIPQARLCVRCSG